MLYAWGQLYWRADTLAPSELLVEHTFSFKSARFMRRFVLLEVFGALGVLTLLPAPFFFQIPGCWWPRTWLCM
jgi:hypothetical protein